MRRQVVVVGAGISGLAAAWAVTRETDGAPVDVTVLERDAEVGGKARTVAEDGYLVECGPTGYLDNEPVMDALVAAGGLTKVPANAAAARRFLVRGGVMREVKAHPLAFARAGILGPLGMMRLAMEPFVPQKQGDADESVWDFARRRIGKQAADRLIAPMMLGVFAGDAKKLSLPSALPRMAEIERTHGSLVKGLIAARKAGRKATGAGPTGVLTSFPEGLQTLPRALASRGHFALRAGTPVAAVTRNGDAWSVHLDGGEPLHADAVVLAVEPWAAADLLRDSASDVSTVLDGIQCPPVIVAALGFQGAEVAQVPQGFGVLIPRGEGYRILGALWDTHLFAGRSPEGRLLVRCMLGGGVDPEIDTLDDAGVLAQVRADLARLLGLHGAPVFQKLVRWKRAIPQYELGHGTKVDAVNRALAGAPGLWIAGNGLAGVAFGKAAAAGVRAGREAGAYVRPA